MPAGNRFCAIELASLSWPSTLQIPSKRFRLFVAVDATGLAEEVIAQFARAALQEGMVYFCVWGPDCSRVHDIVDLAIVRDDLGERLFVGPTEEDTIMTTWHEEDLNEALDFFITVAYPTDGFEAGSDYWVALCVNNRKWMAAIRHRLTGPQ